MDINSFLESLAENPSRNFKIDQLTQFRDNETLREVVRLALDPFTQFYIRKIPKYSRGEYVPMNLRWAMDQLEYLSSRKVTGNAGIEFLKNILESLDEDDAKVIERIIKKDLKCGVSIATANEVWANLIMDYPVMLCSPYEEKLVNNFQFPAFVQLKMDGMRFNAIVRDNKVEYRSRKGKELNLLGNLDKEFIALARGDEWVFDGELVLIDNGSLVDRQTGNGILNKASKGTISDAEAKLVHAVIWDMIPYDDFVLGECNTSYQMRHMALLTGIDALRLRIPDTRVEKVYNTMVSSLEEATSVFQSFLKEGYEGIILKDPSGTWQDKRVKHQVKFKGELECEMRIVAVEEGTGKYEGMLGAIVCQSDDAVVKVNVGSGFSDSQRSELWKQNLLDKIVSIKYNNRIVNKKGEDSLFLPIFVEIREDKEHADYSEDIKFA